MIKHTDYDSGSKQIIEKQLPNNVRDLEITHDGGRIVIYINGDEFFATCLGTRDCSIQIDGD